MRCGSGGGDDGVIFAWRVGRDDPRGFQTVILLVVVDLRGLYITQTTMLTAIETTAITQRLTTATTIVAITSIN